MKFSLIHKSTVTVLTIILSLCFLCSSAQAEEKSINLFKRGDALKAFHSTIELNKDNVILNKKESVQLKAHVNNIKGRRVIWTSSSKGVALVTQKGKIIARGKGKAVITARIKGTWLKARCQVEVQQYKVMRMRTTGYCNCHRCAGKWAGCATASGKMPRSEHTIAVDRRLIPLGTKVQIGDIIYTAEDTGGAIKGHRIDVYYSSHSRASHHGVKYQYVKVFY